VSNTHPTQQAPTVTAEVTLERNNKNQLILNWQEQSNADNYTLYLSTSESFEASKTTEITLESPPHIIEASTNSLQMFAKLRSNWFGNQSSDSNRLSFIAPPIEPNTLTSVVTSENTILLTWNAIETVDSYTLYRSAGDVIDVNGATIIDNITSPYEDISVQADQVYHYWLVTKVNGQASAFSKVTASIVDNPTPLFLAPATFDVSENNSMITTIQTSGVLREDLTFNITGGVDASLFRLESNSGVLTFKLPPDFEMPSDGDLDNVYQLDIEASTGVKAAQQSLKITVLDVDEVPLEELLATGPKVLATYPWDNKTDVEIALKKVDITFDEAMAETSINSDTVRVLRQDRSVVPGTVTYDQAGKTATISMMDNWLVNETYTIEVSANVKDVNGESLAAIFTSTFTTELPVLIAENIIVDEGLASAELTLSLDVLSAKAVTVEYASVEGSATEGLDYAAITGSIVFEPGETSKKIVVAISDDKLYELDEEFSILLSSLDNSATFKNNSATISITNNDPLPTLSISDENVSEAIANGIIEVNLNKPSGVKVTVNYGTIDDSATAPNHYQSVSGSLVFNVGEVSKTFSIPIVDNAVMEEDRSFLVVLSEINGATLADGNATVVIRNDDAPSPPILNVKGGDKMAVLTWEGVLGATTYDVYFANQFGPSPENYSLLNGVALLDQSSPLIISELNNGTEYYFIVVALAGSGKSKLSNQVVTIPNSIDLIHPVLNDTGITFGAEYPEDNNGSCTGETIMQQDCSLGRDATNSDNSDGHAGFDFTKLNANGDPLLADVSEWHCVKDNVTGLIWEIKQSDGGLHDADDRYTWYDENPNTNGGAVGHVNNEGATCNGYDVDNDASFCNTEAYVERVNLAGYCGFNDWRMPTRSELLSIVNYKLDYRSYGSRFLAIDRDYFPNTRRSTYWSSSPYAIDSGSARTVSFYFGSTGYADRNADLYVRLVRNESL